MTISFRHSHLMVQGDYVEVVLPNFDSTATTFQSDRVTPVWPTRALMSDSCSWTAGDKTLRLTLNGVAGADTTQTYRVATSTLSTPLRLPPTSLIADQSAFTISVVASASDSGASLCARGA